MPSKARLRTKEIEEGWAIVAAKGAVAAALAALEKDSAFERNLPILNQAHAASVNELLSDASSECAHELSCLALSCY